MSDFILNNKVGTKMIIFAVMLVLILLCAFPPVAAVLGGLALLSLVLLGFWVVTDLVYAVLVDLIPRRRRKRRNP